jgi:hypothetical protein
MSQIERVVWAGKPSALPTMVSAALIPLAAVILGIPFILLIPDSSGQLTMENRLIIAAILFVGGLAYTGVCSLWAVWKAAGRWYILTTRRAFVFGRGILGPNVEMYGPNELTMMTIRKSWFIAEAGDLVFREESETKKVRDQSGFIRRDTKTTRFGFLGVLQVREVEALVRRTLLRR